MPASGSSGSDSDRWAPSQDHARRVPYAECARWAGHILSTAVSAGLTPVSPPPQFISFLSFDSFFSRCTTFPDPPLPRLLSAYRPITSSVTLPSLPPPSTLLPRLTSPSPDFISLASLNPHYAFHADFSRFSYHSTAFPGVEGGASPPSDVLSSSC